MNEEQYRDHFKNCDVCKRIGQEFIKTIIDSRALIEAKNKLFLHDKQVYEFFYKDVKEMKILL